MKRQFLLPEKAEQSEDGKKEFPEKHDLSISQSIKKAFFNFLSKLVYFQK